MNISLTDAKSNYLATEALYKKTQLAADEAWLIAEAADEEANAAVNLYVTAAKILYSARAKPAVPKPCTPVENDFTVIDYGTWG
jgi:hypothetical protein